MSSVVRCFECAGKKYIIGLGLMRKTCPICNGVGYIEPEEPKSKKKAKEKINDCDYPKDAA
jgi:RecJ-like exonuclease